MRGGLLSLELKTHGSLYSWIFHGPYEPLVIHNITISFDAMGVGLGWMLARDNFMPAAVHDSMAAHTGFTGPVVAIVPQRQLVWALLSNRTWPQRTPPRHHAMTRLVGEVLLDL